MTALLMTLLWIVFTVSAVLLGLIILVQEGKGGGLAEAFGGMGQETFGVGAQGVNRVTGILAGIFLFSAIFINKCAFQGDTIGLPSAPPTDNSAPADPGATGGTPPAPPSDGK